MELLVLILAFGTFLSTLGGGLFLLKFKDRLPYFFAFSAGSLISVAMLELLPESLNIADSINMNIHIVMITVVISFFVYSLIERYLLLHPLSRNPGATFSSIGAGSLIMHSFLDGVVMGASFKVGKSLGIIVAIAIISHDFSDGVDTVVLMLRGKQKNRKAFAFLFMDAVAPIFGVLFISLLNLPRAILAVLLAVFVGEFIYLGASSLLPETKKYSSVLITLSMAAGIILMMVISSLI